MKKHYLFVFILVLPLVLMAAQSMTIQEFELEIWRLTNVQRAYYKIPLLSYDHGLADLSRLHSQNMLKHNFFAHKDHLGDEVGGRKIKYYPSLLVTAIGENLGKFRNSSGAFSPMDVITGWMMSPPHRENILNPEYTHLGVGLVLKGDTMYATQNFATPITKMISGLPKKMSTDKTYRLSFAYLSAQAATKLTATLRFPNKNISYKISEEQAMVGGQPLPIRWTSQTAFNVDIPFLAGKGDYKLCFGFDGGYFPEGITLRAQ